MNLRIITYITVFLSALLPLYGNLRHFKRLFWFGDELWLLREMSQQGFWPWVFGIFAESTVPVFKLLWGGLTILSGGSYLVVVTAVWLTHALNACLLYSLARSTGSQFGWAILSVAFFALTPGTHESLGWTVQWSAVLVSTFFLLGLHSISKIESEKLRVLVTTLCGFGAAFSFARGALACGVLGLGLGFSLSGGILKRSSLCILPMIPAFIAAGLIFSQSTGNHQTLSQLDGATISAIIDFAGTFYLLNPFFRIVFDSTPESGNYYVFGLCKIGVVLFCLWRALISGDKRIQLLIISPLLFDLGNALLLGIGRYHTGWQFAVSSRYQYESLLCIGLASAAACAQLLWRPVRANTFALLLATSLTLYSLPRWQEIMRDWGRSRGREGRAFFFGNPAKRPSQWWGLPPIISRQDAEETIARYNLH